MSFPDWARRVTNRWPESGEVLEALNENHERVQVWRRSANVVAFILLDDSYRRAAYYEHELYPVFDALGAYPVAEEGRRPDPSPTRFLAPVELDEVKQWKRGTWRAL